MESSCGTAIHLPHILSAKSSMNSRSTDCFCIGHAAYDLIFPLDQFPQEDLKYQVEEIDQSGGGPAGNAACLLSKWGATTEFVGTVGNDWCGKQIVEEFHSIGVGTTHLSISPEVATPLSVVLVNQTNGSRTIVNRNQPHSDARLNTERLNKERLNKEQLSDSSPRVLLFDGHELAASLQAMDLYPDAKTVLDGGSLRDSTQLLATKVDFAIVSEKFAREFCNVKERLSIEAITACLHQLKSQCSGRVVITLGDRGSVFEDRGEVRTIDAIPAKAVDTTAAGDIFHGAFVWGLLQEWSLEVSLRFATVAAGLSTERAGGRRSIPDLGEVTEAASRLR